MVKRKRDSTGSEKKRSKNPFILDDVEEVDEDYESDYDEGGESVDGGEPTAKRIRKSNADVREKAAKMSKELAQATREANRRMYERSKRPVDIYANMTIEELQAYAREKYGDMDDDDEALDDDEDYSDDESIDMSGYLMDQGLNLWMVRCTKRRERVYVKRIKRRAKVLKKTDSPLVIANAFFHKEITGLFWAEAKTRKDLLSALRECHVPCAEKNIKMVPTEEHSATYNPRPRKSQEGAVNGDKHFQVGKMVRITQGDYCGREGMVVDVESDCITLIFMPDIDTITFPSHQLEIQEG